MKDGTCSAEVSFRIASAMAAMARPNRIWRCTTIAFASKFKLYKSLVTSILLYGCDTWTLFADSEKRIQAFKTKYLKKLLRILYLERKTTTGRRARSTPLWVHRDGNLHGSGISHATTASPKNILQGTLEGGRHRGRQRKCWMDNIKE